MITIRPPQTKEDFKGYYALRFEVLRHQYGLAKGTEKDDYEPISQHFMAVDEKGQIVGVVKLFEKEPGVAQFSHMAVKPEFQRQGIGHMLLETVEKKARELGFKKIGTMTRLTATNFYEKCGYHVVGFEIVAFGRIQLCWMEKNL
ncbi:MAG TPA: GNAT family N-acetyltransferase [Anaerolineaceae bacterium]|nr:GNAT family N-acetyltransferase [Anaerolineaceae bacterium]HPN51514.1 GNAT family N-acetyltransferase [Anaerolineaceae bacterium]